GDFARVGRGDGPPVSYSDPLAEADRPAPRLARPVPSGKWLRPVRGDDNRAPGDCHRGKPKRGRVAGIRIQMETGRRATPPAFCRAAPAAAGLANVVRGAGLLPQHLLVR